MIKIDTKRYQEFCYDLAEIMRTYVSEQKNQRLENGYPVFRPGFRGYVARKLKDLGYYKISLKLGNTGLIK